MSKGQDTRQRMIAAAAEVLERAGYAGAGINELLEAGKAPRGSLYFHFPGGKEELAVAALEVSAAEMTRLLQEHLSADRALVPGLRRVLTVLADRSEAAGFEKGCPVSAVVLSSGATPEPVRHAASEALRTWQHLLAERLRAEGLGPAESRRRSGLLLSAVEGALLLARAHRSRAPVDELSKELERLLSLES
ncbi:TetR/AcrR family transcriptional regulator [Vitiosangium sp. GDMCC 1.1324]|uniref:TetR/AcrR family transcriptional regulator n=1 Tax=Vitiosangium sp. (strain GDMCC 1.1324) TaxID=2138576 RepID=UPI000D3A6905|nr:TetR/AcrR family transcriptional regulator [Vitiosangium sp. GDMCC 1.1324]PTL83232.1 TetR family transcriptional regulator [Vitiosangium sp. GDMCC 1.1324]